MFPLITKNIQINQVLETMNEIKKKKNLNYDNALSMWGQNMDSGNVHSVIFVHIYIRFQSSLDPLYTEKLT